MLDDNAVEVDVRAIAIDIDTPADVLLQLSEDFNPEIRALVASHPNTPENVLLKLGEEFPEAITANPIFNLLVLENPDAISGGGWQLLVRDEVSKQC